MVRSYTYSKSTLLKSKTPVGHGRFASGRVLLILMVAGVSSVAARFGFYHSPGWPMCCHKRIIVIVVIPVGISVLHYIHLADAYSCM